jgi:hypothetical protein
VAFLLAFLLVVSAQTVERSLRTHQSLDVTPLDVAFLDADRLFLLSEETLSLYRMDSARLTLLSRLALPGVPLRARAAGGMLRVVAQDGACWALSNRRAGATLFSLDGDRLVAVAGADAIPPTAFGPGEASPEGIRFVAGTNLLAVGDAALLRFAGDGDAIERDGTLRLRGEPDALGRRAGDALAVLDERHLAVSAGRPPDGSDEVRILDRGVAEPVVTWSTKGRVRAIARRPTIGAPMELAVAVEAERGPILEILGLRWGDR